MLGFVLAVAVICVFLALGIQLLAALVGGGLRVEGYAILDVAVSGSFQMGVETEEDSPHMDARREGLVR